MPIRHNSQSHPLGEGHLSFPHHRFRRLSFHEGLNLMLHLHASTVRRHIWPAMVCCNNSIQLISIPLEILFLSFQVLFHFPLREFCFLLSFNYSTFVFCRLAGADFAVGSDGFGHKARRPFAPETGNRGIWCLPHEFVRWL